MNIFSGILNGLAEIRAHKLRSALTALSVMLGVAALVVVMGLLFGVFAQSEEDMAEYGGLERIYINTAELPASQQHLASRQRPTNLDDVREIRRQVEPDAVLATWEDRMNVSRGAGSLRATVRAVQPAFFVGTKQWRVASGRGLGALDGRDRARSAVIGTAVVEACFPRGEEPLGRMIRLEDEMFRVVGVLEHYDRTFNGRNLLERKNATVFVPLETAQAVLMDEPQLGELSVDAPRVEDVGGLMQRMLNLMVQLRRGLRDTEVRSNLEFYEDYARFQQTFYLAGFLVGGISLLVGGIGIMNLMMASVNERIREIGIRKAVGAWPRDIFVQFVAEAVTLSMLGGVLGLALGKGVIEVIARTMSAESPPIFSPTVALIGFVFSVGVGVAAGIYPAFRAARMDPVDALRYE